MKVFVDSSAFIALADGDDQHHPKATLLLEELISDQAMWVTTNYIFDETVSYLRRRAGAQAAHIFGESFRRSGRIHQIWIDEAFNELVWAYFSKHRDHLYSYTDCASFVVMKEHHIHSAFTFDEHFRQAGFQLLHLKGG